jgi:hypothetical protein
MSKLLLVNLYGGPGCGKSTGMAYLFSHLKMAGVNCEMVPEFAKELVWEERFKTLSDQIYVFGKQQKRIKMLEGKVDVVITDSPLLLSLHYGKDLSSSFNQLVFETYSQYDCMSFLLKRVKEYNPNGRMQTEDQAKDIDVALIDLLINADANFHQVTGDQDGYDFIFEKIIYKLESMKNV